MKTKIDQYIDSKRQEYLDALTRLIAIPSVRGEAADGAPYGAEPLRALHEGLAIAAEWGLSGQNSDNIVACIDLLPENDDHLHILAHLDVVPINDGWTKEPFAMTLEDGNLYGRGVADDKGPALAALLALRCVKELGVPLAHNCRLILGTDEECGSSDIAHYYSKHPFAANSFTPDADFPMINTEKGTYRPVITARWEPTDKLPRVLSITGSGATNVIPGKAAATVAGVAEDVLQKICEQATARTGVTFVCTPAEEGALITAVGTGAHAAMPEGGNNALTALLELLTALPLNSDDRGNQIVQSLHDMFPHGDYQGKTLGIDQADESGPLTLAFTMCDFAEGQLRAQFDSRVPICANDENCRNICVAACEAAGLTIEGSMAAAHHVPADSPFIQTLLDALEIFTGERGEPLAIGGGTYVHNIPGGVAFGCVFPGVEPNMHGADETIPLEDLFTSAKIFAKAIIDLCGEPA